MPKATMTIAQLEQLLTKQKNRLKELQEKKEKLGAQISRIDEEMASLKGTAAAAPKKARRAPKREGKSLREHVIEILKASPEPMNAREIAGAVKKAGYKSSSKNFVTLVRLFCYKSDELQRKGKGKFTVKGGK